MHLFAAVMFLLVGFIMITVSVCALIVLTRWKWITPVYPTLFIFITSTALFLHRYSLNWHVLLRPIILSAVFYLAMVIGMDLASRIPDDSPSNASLE
jgi:hypothetical protein